jgi:NADH-quinone oxidoreductase subunit J
LWIGPGILSAILLSVLVYAILSLNDQGIDGTSVSAKQVGIALFGPYVLAVELASMLLLAGLVVAFHLGREDRPGEVLSNRQADQAVKRKTEEHV